MKLTEEQLNTIIQEEIISCINERAKVDEGLLKALVNPRIYTKAFSAAMKGKRNAKLLTKSEKAAQLAVNMAKKMGVKDVEQLKEIAINAKNGILKGGNTWSVIMRVLKGFVKIAIPIALLIFAFKEVKKIDNAGGMQEYTKQNSNPYLDLWNEKLGKTPSEPEVQTQVQEPTVFTNKKYPNID